MYTAHDALRDLNTVRYHEDFSIVNEPYQRLVRYLWEQKNKENIPELLRRKNGG